MKQGIVFFTLMTILFSGASFASEDSTLEQIKKTGEIRIGYRKNEPPMSFLDKDNQPIGYSIELCLNVVKEVKILLKTPNITVTYVPVTASNRFDALIGNKIDILCGSTTKTLSRSELVDFTQLSFVTGADLLSLKDNRIASVSSLKDKKVAVVKDTTTEATLKSALKRLESNAKVITVASAKEGIKAVEDGKVDAFSSDQIILIGLIVTHEGSDKFILSDQVFSYEPFALAVRRNDSEFRLIADRAISKLSRTGNITQVYKTWFGQYITEIPSLLGAVYMLNAIPE
jgi:ABC-type amino acid transport substrate-binding protein